MQDNPYSRYREIKESIKNHPDWSIEKIAKDGSWSPTTVRRARDWIDPGVGNEFKESKKVHNINQEFSDDKLIITARSYKIHTIDDLLKFVKIDLDIWEVDKVIAGTWEITGRTAVEQISNNRVEHEFGSFTNTTIKVILKKKAPHERVLQRILEYYTKHKPVYPKKFPKPKGDHLFIPSIYDVHWGMLVWKALTGQNYDLKIAEKIYRNAVMELISRIGNYNIEKIIFPIGQDLFHINDHTNETPTNHNRLQVDGRIEKIIEAAYIAVKDAIDAMIPVAPVEIIYSADNHGFFPAWVLTFLLETHYKAAGVSRVTVDKQPISRKYRLYGNTLIGFAHEPKTGPANYGSIMPTDASDLWSQSKYREMLIGHKHRDKVDTFNSVVVRMVPSLCPVNEWEFDKGWVGTRQAAHGYFYHKENGPIGHFIANVRI